MSSTVIGLAFAVASNGSGARGRIDAIGVSQHAGGHQILHEVSVSIESGSLVAVIGGSGAGKTTLLEVQAGVRPPSAGERQYRCGVAHPAPGLPRRAPPRASTRRRRRRCWRCCAVSPSGG